MVAKPLNLQDALSNCTPLNNASNPENPFSFNGLPAKPLPPQLLNNTIHSASDGTCHDCGHNPWIPLTSLYCIISSHWYNPPLKAQLAETSPKQYFSTTQL